MRGGPQVLPPRHLHRRHSYQLLCPPKYWFSAGAGEVISQGENDMPLLMLEVVMQRKNIFHPPLPLVNIYLNVHTHFVGPRPQMLEDNLPSDDVAKFATTSSAGSPLEKIDDIAQLNIVDDFDNRPPTKAKKIESGVLIAETEFKNHQSREHSDRVFDSVKDPIYDEVLWRLGNQVATGHHGGSLRCPPATLCTTPQQDGRELFGMPAHRNDMTSYTLKDTFVRLDLTLTDATMPPLLLEIRRVSLLLLCFHGCFNALPTLRNEQLMVLGRNNSSEYG